MSDRAQEPYSTRGARGEECAAEDTNAVVNLDLLMRLVTGSVDPTLAELAVQHSDVAEVQRWAAL